MSTGQDAPVPPTPAAVHLDLDGAWSEAVMGLSRVDARAWGPRLRYLAPDREVEAFAGEMEPRLVDFVLYGSGDFHYLAAVFLRRAAGRAPAGSISLVSFDNHPDWDRRPPRWACGGWINRALEMESLREAAVWGCGNFELNWPGRIWRNRRAIAARRLRVFAWEERISSSARRMFGSISRRTWREDFESYVEQLRTAGGAVYVTVDLDCLRTSATNWENGLFEAEDVAWAVGRLREKVKVLGGDLCGAWSKEEYARRGQRFAGRWDHPRVQQRDAEAARRANEEAVQAIWRAMVGQGRQEVPQGAGS